MADVKNPAAKKTRKVTPIDPNESKLDRFHRVAEPRIRKALKAIRLVKACTAKATYEFTPEDVERIQNAFIEEINALAAAFAGKQVGDVDFSFRR